jgi:tRNA (cytidine/uridine-2'-O-)-methyltransferase
MDYWKELQVIEHKDWESFTSSPLRPQNVYLLTTHAEKALWDQEFERGDGLLFGNEGHGAPEYVHQWVKSRITIPKYNHQLRSLNLAVSVGIASYEALRQLKH